MSAMAKNVEALLGRFDITAETLARIAGVSPSTVSRWRNGNSRMRDANVRSICDHFELVPDDLLSESNGLFAKVYASNDPDMVDVPIYGAIAAGVPIDMAEIDDTFPIPAVMRARYPKSFLLKVEGNSMNLDFQDGSYVLVNPQHDIDLSGQPYAVCVNGNTATVKRVRKLGNGFELRPNSTDPTYRPAIYDYGVEGTETITVIGRVVWDVKPLDWTY